VVACQTHAAARDALEGLVRAIIRPAIRWIGSRILNRGGQDLGEWATQEEEQLGWLLLEALLTGGCHCWEQGPELSEQQSAAFARCVNNHDLRRWDCSIPLQDFLFEALIYGNLRLPDPEHGIPEQARACGFRHGMLAKEVADQRLRGGRILRCSYRPGCAGEIQRSDDRCDGCDRLSHVENESWWLWCDGERVAVPCRRCLPRRGGCNCLYFNHHGNCPGCHALAWSGDPTEVWVRIMQLSLPPGGDSPGSGPPDVGAADSRGMARLLGEENLAHLRDWLRTRPEHEQTLVEGVLLRGETIHDMAERLGVPARHAKQHLRAALEHLPPGLLPQPSDLDRGEE
jgi:hypothetical protein